MSIISCTSPSPSERILPASRSDGTNTKLASPVRAAAAATALARLPVDAHAAVLKPKSSALPSATATTRSLNEFVGLRVSSLSQRSVRPSSAPSRSARMSGVHPAARAAPAGASTGRSGPYRQIDAGPTAICSREIVAAIAS